MIAKRGVLNPSACPTREVIADLLRDTLDRPQTKAWEDHLTGCLSCFERFRSSDQNPGFPKIEHFHLIRELGRGRFGVVYKAWWLQRPPRIVALKVLTFAGEMERRRFEREITVLRKMDSPHIVKCLDAGRTGDTRYYVMNFVGGVHLDEFLAGAQNLDEKLAVFQRVCGAVAAAHARGVVHRDLKPRNILIDPNGQPYLLDFGICSLGAAEWNSSMRGTITQFGDLIGTLKYMSPEQAWGGVSGPIDARSDVWALGVMLYEIVTDGDYPYALGPAGEKSAHEALLDRIRKEIPRRPRLQGMQRGADLEVLVERCLTWESSRRLASTAQLADDIERYRHHQPIKTKPAPFWHRWQRLAVGAAVKARGAVLLAWIATVLTGLFVATYLFDVRWRVTGLAYGVSVDAPAAVSATGGTRANVVLGAVFDDTPDVVVRFARQRGLDGVSRRVTSWRGVHGLLMERLAEVRPKAVVWDYFFRTPQPGDAGFVVGVHKLQRAGVPVILAALQYDQAGQPWLSPGITKHLQGCLHHGTIVARDMVRREGEFVMAIRRSNGFITPHLALTTLAAVLHPSCQLDLDWPSRGKHLALLYRTSSGDYLRERDRIALKWPIVSQIAQLGASRDSELAIKAFALEQPPYWRRRTVAYQQLLTGSVEELRDMVAGKVLVIGDFRTPRLGFVADRHPVRFGRTVVQDVPGCYLLADAVAGLLERRYMKVAFPLSTATFAAILLLTIISCLIPIRLATQSVFDGRTGRRSLGVFLFTLGLVSFLVMVTAESYAPVWGGMAGCCASAALGGSFWVAFARNRYRILDRGRRAVEDLAFASNETLTIT